MKSLDEVLVQKNEIKARVQDFGYSDVIRVASDTTPAKMPTVLGLIVTKIPGTSVSYKHRGWLIEILSKELRCHVNVTVLDNVEETLKYDVMRKSAPLDDNEALCKLFDVASLEKVKLKFPENSNATILHHAEGYLHSRTNETKATSDAENLGRFALMPAAAEEAPSKKHKHGSSNESSSNNSPNSQSSSPQTDQSHSPQKK